MADKINGALIWQGEGKKRRRLLKWEKKDGTMTMPNIFSPEQLDKELEASQETEIPVELELEGGRPVRIRPVGKDWQGKVPPPKTPQKTDYKQQGYDQPNAQTFQDKPYSGEKEMKGEFHNPYNFVPAVPREDVNKLRDEKGEKHDLADKPPAGHDRFLADKLSGKLSVRMTVETPLLLPDTARIEVNEKEHKSFPVRVGADGKPEINPTAVKGMLRAAYEAITNSRLSVFQKHGERLAFRMEANQALSLRPVRIHSEKEIHFYEAAWLGEYKWRKKNWKNLDMHRKKVWVKVQKSTHQRRGFSYFEVIDLEDINKPKPSTDWVEGYVCITNENMQKKHDERVFFKTHSLPSPEILSQVKWETLQKSWENLIENYKEIHKDEPQPPANLKIKEWSRHIKEKREEVLDVGTLCYASVKKNSSGTLEVENLFPVMISRQLYEVSPEALLGECLRPAIDIETLSPADRVFGWVRQGNERSKQGAYRGQIRIGAVSCERKDAIEDFGDNCIPLQILGQPKPQQGRFYVAETQNGEAQTQKRNNKGAGYKHGRGLRGRKVYPHHASLPDGYWVEDNKWKAENGDLTQEELVKNGTAFFREYIHPKSDKRQDSQNRSIQGWVKKGVEFKFDIHFINLSKIELGALIWLLQLNEGLETPTYFHRFGGGKPLGFGSVRLNVDGSKIFTGEELKQRYESLGDISVSPSVTAESCKTGFEKALKEAYPTASFLEAFKRSAKGFDDSLPIHYPRARHYKVVKDEESGEKKKEWVNELGKPLPPHVDGLAYEWFVANNQVQSGQVKYRYVLPDLVDRNSIPDKGLEILSSEVKDKYQNAQTQNRDQRNPKNRGGRRR